MSSDRAPTIKDCIKNFDKSILNGGPIAAEVNSTDNKAIYCWTIKVGLENILNKDTLASTPDVAYAVRCLAKIQEKSNDNDPSFWQRQWLRHCLSDKTEYLFGVIKELDTTVDREADVKWIVQNGLSEDGQPLWKRIASANGVKYYRDTIADWYLQRYNYQEAIRAGLNNSRLAWVLPSLGLFYIVFCLLMYTDLGKAVGVVEALSFFLLGVTVSLSIVFRNFVRFFYPRLAGAVAIGLIPLVMEGTMWTLPFRLGTLTTGLIAVFSLIAAVLYFSFDCSRATGSLSRLVVFKRAVVVAIYGFMVSVILSVIFTDLFADHLTDFARLDQLSICPIAFKGLLGHIYPNVVVFFASISLLIGILIQLFWDEKPATKPL